MNKIAARYFIIFLILGVPILALLYLKRGTNKYKDLPYFGNPSGINSKGDTVKHTIPPFSFSNQDGKAFGSSDLKGKIYIAEFFFTRCPSICPVMAKNLEKILEAFPKENNLNIVSFSVDPAHDSTPVLKKYAIRNGLTDPRWYFLTGNKDSIYALMNTNGFLILKPEPNDVPAEFKHSGTLSLIDTEGHIRGEYDGTRDGAIDSLIEDIQVLRVNHVRNIANK